MHPIMSIEPIYNEEYYLSIAIENLLRGRVNQFLLVTC